MTSQHDDHQENQRFDHDLRRAAGSIHPRAEFVYRLRRELNNRPRREPFRLSLPSLRRYLPQAAALAALTALVVLGLILTPQLLRGPALGTAPQATAMPGQPRPNSDGLPNGALARLGLGQILSLDVAADRRLAVGSTLGLCVYDTGYMPLWCRQMGTPYNLGWVTFNPAGDRLALVMSEDSTSAKMLVLDAASGDPLAEHLFPPDQYGFPLIDSKIAWDPSGQPRLVMVGEDSTLLVWDWQANTTVWGPLDIYEAVTGGNGVFGIDWALDGQGRSRVAAGGEKGLLLLDGESGQEILRLDPTFQSAPIGFISAVDFSPDGQWLAYGHTNGASALRFEDEAITGRQNWPTGSQPLRVAFGPQSAGMPLAVLDHEGLNLFHLEDEPAAQFSPAGAGPLAWSPDGALFYAQTNGMLGAKEEGTDWSIPTQYTAWPERIAWSSTGEIIAVDNASITAWDAGKAELAWVSTVTEQTPLDLAISSDGARAAYYLKGKNAVQLWDTATNKPLARLEPVELQALAAFSADGARLVTIDRSGQLIAWDTASGQPVHRIEAVPPDTQVDALAVSPDGLTAALGWVNQGELRLDLLDLESGQVTASLPISANVRALAWSPDGSRLAEISSGRVVIWDAATGQELQRMGAEPYWMASDVAWQGQGNDLLSLVWSPDGKTLATGGGLVTIWDVEQGLPIMAFGGHRGRVNALAFRPDGLALTSASRDGTILLWNVGAGPQPTAEPLPSPTPLPIEPTPPPLPTEANAPASLPDLSTYNVRQSSYTSPDGQWTAEVVSAEAQPHSPRQENYLRLVVRNKVDSITGEGWIFEESTPASMRVGWSEMKWDRNAMYWYDNVTRTDFCEPDRSYNLRKMDLTTGEVTPVPGFGPDWQGRLAFAPDTPEFAYLDGAELVIRTLEGDERQRIPFQPLDPNSWGARPLVYQPGDYGLVMIQYTPADLMCSGAEVREGVVVFQVTDGTVLQREIPAGYQFRGYDVAGVVDLLAPDGSIHLLDLRSGALDAAPPATGEEQAGQVLWDFLAALANQDYVRAAQIYGGELTIHRPGASETFADAASLLRNACESGGYVCQPVSRIFASGERDGFNFAVFYSDGAGGDLSVDGESMFSFRVKAGTLNHYQVITLPPRPAAVDALISFTELLAEGSRSGDPAMFDKAAPMYGGSPRSFDPRLLTRSETVELLRQACSQGVTSSGASLCLKPLAVRLGKPLTAERVRLWLQFEDPEGGAWETPDGNSWFPFTVLRQNGGLWLVADLPPTQHSALAHSAHLTDAETAGLDEANILHLLWQEALEQSTSPLLSDRERLTGYEVHKVTLDPRIDNLKSEFNLDEVGWVNYSVQTVVEQSNWVAGNGELDGQWVRHKVLIIGLVREDGANHLVVIGTGP